MVNVGESYDEYASVGRRLVAGVVDWVIAIGWGALVGLLGAIGFYVVFNPTHGVQIGAGLIYVFPSVALIVIALTHVMSGLMVSSKGASFGQRLVRLRVVAMDGVPISWRRGVVRQFAGSPLLLFYVIPMFFLITVSLVLTWLSALDYATGRVADVVRPIAFNWLRWAFVVSVVLAVANHVWMVLDSQRRGWQDVMAGTVVVRELDLRTNPAPSP